MSTRDDQPAGSVNTSVRLPRELHDRIKAIGEKRDRTPHYLILRYIQAGVEADEARLAEGGYLS
jgi:predicted transcriptional regulator